MKEIRKVNGKDPIIENRIISIRGIQAMVDRDLAELYMVEVKRLNEQVKRNIGRFPSTFRFQLTTTEKRELVANCDRFNSLKHSTLNPYVFTEQGVAMLSAVLKSNIAIDVSIQIMNAFVEMRKQISQSHGLIQRIERVEKKQLHSDQKFEKIFKALESTTELPRQGVFFDGQVFDAHLLVSRIIKKANKSIWVIDSYLDESVLIQLGKKKKNVEVILLSKSISKQMELDIKKANDQYLNIRFRELKNCHDRFIILDQEDVYHLGASLKDLGKKWFAFSKIDKESVTVLRKIKEMLQN
jgi:hypothetical protein